MRLVLVNRVQVVTEFFLWGAIVIGLLGFISGFILTMYGDPWGLVSIISSIGIFAIGFWGLTND